MYQTTSKRDELKTLPWGQHIKVVKVNGSRVTFEIEEPGEKPVDELEPKKEEPVDAKRPTGPAERSL